MELSFLCSSVPHVARTPEQRTRRRRELPWRPELERTVSGGIGVTSGNESGPFKSSFGWPPPCSHAPSGRSAGGWTCSRTRRRRRTPAPCPPSRSVAPRARPRLPAAINQRLHALVAATGGAPRRPWRRSGGASSGILCSAMAAAAQW